jgi:hypothetical protein
LAQLPELGAFSAASVARKNLTAGTLGKGNFLPQACHGAAVPTHVIEIDVELLLPRVKRRGVEGVVDAFLRVALADVEMAAINTAGANNLKLVSQAAPEATAGLLLRSAANRQSLPFLPGVNIRWRVPNVATVNAWHDWHYFMS